MTIDTNKLRAELDEAPYIHRRKALPLLDELDRLREQARQHQAFQEWTNLSGPAPNNAELLRMMQPMTVRYDASVAPLIARAGLVLRAVWARLRTGRNDQVRTKGKGMETEREFGGYVEREIEAQWVRLPGGIIAWDLLCYMRVLRQELDTTRNALQSHCETLYQIEKDNGVLNARLDYLAREQYGEHAARCVKMAQPVPSFDNFCLLMWQAIDERIEKGRIMASQDSA